MQTPQTTTLTVAAGARAEWPVQGQAMLIVSITPATSIQGAFGNDPYQTFLPGLVYPASNGPFESIRFYNATGLTQTLVVCAGALTLSNSGSPDIVAAVAAGNAVLATIDADTSNLAAILAATQRLDAGSTPTLVARTTVAQVGAVPSYTLILPANANRRWFCLEAGLANAGYVYLGFADTVTAVNSFDELAAGAFCREAFKGAVYACSDNGTETIKGYEVE